MAKFKVGDKVEIKKKKNYITSFKTDSLQKCLEELAGEVLSIVNVDYSNKPPLVRVVENTTAIRWWYETSAVKHV